MKRCLGEALVPDNICSLASSKDSNLVGVEIANDLGRNRLPKNPAKLTQTR